MNVLVSINKEYIRHFEVMLHSLLGCTRKRISVFVLHDDLSGDDETAIKRTFPEVKFSFVLMDGSLCEGFPTVKRYPSTVYYRIFAPLFLPRTVDKILYLDCDVILHNPIDDFYETPLGDDLFAGCSHTGKFLSFFNRARLGVGREYVYLNTGVLLMNVAALRTALKVEVLKDYTLKNKRRLMLYDQDVICRFFGNRVLPMDPLVFNLSDRQIRRYNFFNGGRINAEWVRENNVAVHYIGRNKPWKNDYKGILGGYYAACAADLDSARKQPRRDREFS